MENGFAEKMDVVLKDEDFVVEVCTAESVEEVKALFKAKDIELDDDAANAFFEKVKSSIDSELSEEDLEEVNGGGICATLAYYGVATLGGYAVVGVVAGIALGFACVKLYSFLKYGR